MRSLSYDIIFACKKKEDYRMWIDAIKKLQAETELRKSQIRQKQQVMDCTQENGN
jgi:hypothetical protein